MNTLDLHGLRHDQVELTVENFVLLEEMPVKIVTGNSLTMRNIVEEVLSRHDFSWDIESHFNLGAIVVNNSR